MSNQNQNNFKSRPRQNNRDSDSSGRTYHNHALESGFASLRDKIQTRRPPKNYGEKTYKENHTRQNVPNIPAVNNLGKEGDDHINVHHHSNTELGRALSVYGDLEFMHNKYGKFRTIHGLMSYLGHTAQPDEFRTVDGFGVQKVRRQFPSNTYVPEYQWVVIDATWQKIKAHPPLAKLFYESSLPFDFYYLQIINFDRKESVRVRMFDTYEWMNRGLTELRNALREGRDPDLTFLMSPGFREEYIAERKRTAEETKKREDAKDAVRLTNTCNAVKLDGVAQPLRKDGDVLYLRDQRVRHNRRLYLNYRTMVRLINDFKNTDKQTHKAYFAKVLSAPYSHIARVGVVIDKGTVLNKDNRYETFSVFEVAHGDTRSNVDVQFVAIPTTVSQITTLRSTECSGVDLTGMYSLEGITDADETITVIKREQSVDCGAEQVEFKAEYIPEAIRGLVFRPLTSADAAQYYVATVQEGSEDVLTDSIAKRISGMETYYEENIRHNRMQLKDVETLAYILDASQLVNGQFNAYEIKHVTFETPTEQDALPKPDEVVLWYFGDNSIRKLTPRVKGGESEKESGEGDEQSPQEGVVPTGFDEIVKSDQEAGTLNQTQEAIAEIISDKTDTQSVVIDGGDAS